MTLIRGEPYFLVVNKHIIKIERVFCDLLGSTFSQDPDKGYANILCNI